MKCLLVLLPVVFLAGCVHTVPVTMSFPQVPEELKVSCPDLQQIPPKTKKLSEVVTVVAKNYGQYQECQVKVNAWVQWYITQKKIFEEVE